MTATRPGLRELKKQRTRWAIQEHALRLIAEHGYDATTVEQIAAAAEVSPATFFRYFPTKEDVIVEDEYDPVLISAIEAAPADLPPIPAVRHALRTAFRGISPAARELVRQRSRLLLSVPALRSRTMDNMMASIGVLGQSLAVRLGRAPDDPGARVLAGAVIGGMIAAVLDWVGRDDLDLADALDTALAQLEAATR